MDDEKNVSTQQSQEKEDPRFSGADEERRRSPGSQTPSGEGPQEARRLRSPVSRAFPPRVRLRKRREYQQVYRKGFRLTGSMIVLFVLPTGLGRARLGITATKKVGGSVQRNRVRRRIREIYRHRMSRLASWDLVVNVRRRSVEGSYDSIEKEFLALVARAKRRFSLPKEIEPR